MRRSDDKHIQFNGNAYITADGIPFDSYNTFTIEAWLKDWEGPILGQGLIRDDPENGIVMSPKTCGWESRKGGNYLLSVGDKLPDFRLPDQHGRIVHYEEDRAGAKSVVVFYRSTVW